MSATDALFYQWTIRRRRHTTFLSLRELESQQVKHTHHSKFGAWDIDYSSFTMKRTLSFSSLKSDSDDEGSTTYNINMGKRKEKQIMRLEDLQGSLISPCKKMRLSDDTPTVRFADDVQVGTDSSEKSGSAGHRGHIIHRNGQLKLTAYMNFGLLTVHVVQGRGLSSKSKSQCDSYVKMCIIPDEMKRTKCKTSMVLDTNNPVYDEKFSFELLEQDYNRRLLVSLWHKDQTTGLGEFLGSSQRMVLPVDRGYREKKHLHFTNKQKPELKLRSNGNIPVVNKDVWGSEPVSLTVYRGKGGFGFSVTDSCPARVSHVDSGSPADIVGLQTGDLVIRVNGLNVSRSMSTSVAKVIKHSSNKLLLDLQRARSSSTEKMEKSPWKSTPTFTTGTQKLSNGFSSEEEDQEANKENMISVEVHAEFREPANFATSTPLPLLCNGHATVQTSERRKQEAVHRILSLEMEYIDTMHSGMQRYSRPLRHCILLQQQHGKLFQNIEKLVSISEYHLKQMHDNLPSVSSSDTDTSASSDGSHFVTSVGMIYQSKIVMLCQAYDLYINGLNSAIEVLQVLKKNDDFLKYIKDPPLVPFQPSISAFIYRPVQHIRELFHVLNEIFTNTSEDSDDYKFLQETSEKLKESVNRARNHITDNSEGWTMLSESEPNCARYGSGTMKFGGHSSGSSGSSTASGQSSLPPSCSMQTVRSIDSEVQRIQDRLTFAANVPMFQLCQEERHVIYMGDIFKWSGTQWTKVYAVLLTDLLLLIEKEDDMRWHVVHEPIYLRDISGLEAQGKFSAEFVLHWKPRKSSSRSSVKQRLVFCAPSTEQKFAWKSLLEQKVFSLCGTLECYNSSSSDMSTGSTIII
ncbi:hypothetical protein ScPMuIL_010694 [Solemya velum]